MLEENDYATVAGISLSHSDVVKLKCYSKSEGVWYCERLDGWLCRFRPDQLTKLTAMELTDLGQRMK